MYEGMYKHNIKDALSPQDVRVLFGAFLARPVGNVHERTPLYLVLA